MSAPAQLLTDLPGGDGERGTQGVEDAGLAHAGVAGKHAEPPPELLLQLLDALAGDGAGEDCGEASLLIDVRQCLRPVLVGLIDADERPRAGVDGDGGHAVDEKGVGDGDGPGGHDHHLVNVGDGRAGKAVAPGQKRVHHALPRSGEGIARQIPYQGGLPRVAEFSPGAAGDKSLPGLHVVEAAKGLYDPSLSH